jgi:hypothetical protein
MQKKPKPITQIRRAGLAKTNQLVRAAQSLDKLRPAFAQWQAGEVFVGKSGAYRFRFGKNSKLETPWSGVARDVFSSPAAFAFAAMVLAPDASEPITKEPEPLPVERANVMALAQKEAA